MSQEHLLEDLRQEGQARLLSEVRITAGKSTVGGVGLLKVASNRFVLSITVSREDEALLPKVRVGVLREDEYWSLEGTINDAIGFSVKRISPPSGRSFGENGVTLTLATEMLDIEASGFDTMTTAELSAFCQSIAASGTDPAASSQNAAPAKLTEGCPEPASLPVPPPQPGNPKVGFCVVLADYDLVTYNAGVTVKEDNAFIGSFVEHQLWALNGETEHWRYSLVRRGKDLHAELASKPGYGSLSEEEDRRRLQAFLASLAFTNGQHAYPLSLKHYRDGKLVLHRIHLRTGTHRTRFAPFSQQMAFATANGHMTWDYLSVLERAYCFFLPSSKLTSEIINLLYLLREAGGDRVPLRIRTLSVCVLFESLLQLLCEEELHLPKPEKLTAADRMTLVVRHLGLAQPARWTAVFNLWKRLRNPLSHRIAKRGYSPESFEEEVLAASRIVGAINCIILRLMNYDGPFRISELPEEYAKMCSKASPLAGARSSS